MKIKLLIIFVCFIGAIYFNFSNKHQVIISSQRIETLLEELQSKQEINQDLLATNSKLLARNRIKKLASEELGMLFSSVAPQTIGIGEEDNYRLIDFLVPTVEALNK